MLAAPAVPALFEAAVLQAQTNNGNMTGVVVDSSGARVAGAQIVLRNTHSGDKRTSYSNKTGNFSFNSVPAATYTLSVTKEGFETLITKDIELHPNDKLNLAELRMEIGAENVSVTVEANTDISTSGERSSLITAKDIQKLSTVGRDVSELLRTQAGFSQVQTGLDNAGAQSAEVAGAYSGLNNYVGNGATANGASVIADGANVTDPGSGSGQTQIVNMDMVQEVKVETSNFGADTAKGPTVITAVGKSGGQSYHGNIQLYARTYQLNGQDWFSKYQRLPQIPDRYLYPGAGVGGPVRIPGTNFNRSKKLTFQLNGEGYLQSNSYAYGSPIKSFLQALLPTQAMRQGDFSVASLANYLGVDQDTIRYQCNTKTANLVNGRMVPNPILSYTHACALPTTTNSAFPGQATRNFTGGRLVGGVEPNANAMLNGLYPVPTDATVKGFNYHQLNLVNPNLYQARLRLDYAINDQNKFYVTYNGQFGTTTGIPENIYYSPGTSNSAVLGGVNTPGKTNSTSRSNLGSLNYTRILNQHMTNEIFAGISTSEQYYNPGDLRGLQGSTYGYSSSASFFPTASTQLPSYATYSTTGSQVLPFSIIPDFSAGQYIAKKFLPSGGDNFSYVFHEHTFKIGFYGERDTANQTNLSPQTNGTVATYYMANVTTCDSGTQAGCLENYLADFMLGAMGSFTQQNKNLPTNLYYWTLSGYLTDSYKVTKRLTLDYGVRFDHLGPWQDKHGLGLPIFSDALYQSDPHTPNIAADGTVSGGALNPDGTAFLPGVRWAGGNSATNLNAGYRGIASSATPGRWAFVSPRVGVAFDARGDGNTIIRGGWGQYRAHDSWNDYIGAAQTPEGIFTRASVSSTGYVTFAQLASSVAAGGAAGTSIFALDPNDNRQPLTETYSLSVSQRMPGNSVFDIAYVGNQSHDLLTDNASNTAVNSNDLRDINSIPVGSFFRPDPNPSSPFFGQVANTNNVPTGQQNDYRRYPFYAHIGVPRHITYANYNALQTNWTRQKGRLNYGLNYTWSRAQGVRGAYNNGLTGDPTNLRANYGPLGFDRTHILNLSYSFDTQGTFHSPHRWVRALGNGILISGITNLQSGPNLQAVGSPNLFLTGQSATSYNGANCGTGGNNCAINSNTVLGTPDVLLQPTLRASDLCPSGDASKGLAEHQYINGNCFGIPQVGVNGPANLGYLRGPAFFNSDLTLQKTIPLHESANFQLRIAAFNFLNHPVTSFSSRYPQEVALQFADPANGTSGFNNVILANTTNSADGSNGNCSYKGSTCFGYAGYKTGRRVLELEARYNF